jgi:hypothetical protein
MSLALQLRRAHEVLGAYSTPARRMIHEGLYGTREAQLAATLLYVHEEMLRLRSASTVVVHEDGLPTDESIAKAIEIHQENGREVVKLAREAVELVAQFVVVDGTGVTPPVDEWRIAVETFDEFVDCEFDIAFQMVASDRVKKAEAALATSKAQEQQTAAVLDGFLGDLERVTKERDELRRRLNELENKS